jgi:hypothetical protein
VSGIHEDHERLTESLSAYLDGALARADRDALERHLATCETCREELAELQRVRALLRALPEPALPRSFALPTSAARAGARRPARGGQGWARAAQWTGGLAAALGAGLLVAGVLQPITSTMNAGARFGASSSAQTGSATNSYPGISPTHGPGVAQHSPSVDTTDTITPTGAIGATARPTVAPTSSATAGSGLGSGRPGDNSASSPLLPAGATLLVGGGAALAAGTVSRRRTRREARAR